MRAGIGNGDRMPVSLDTPVRVANSASKGAEAAMCIAAVITLCGLLAATAGCGLLAFEQQETAHKPFLPPLVSPRDAISLDVYFIERPAGDPLIGETLWRQLDEVGFVSGTNTRGRLRSTGLRVGSAGSNPPKTLRAAATEERTESKQVGRPQSLTLFAGQQATLETAIIEEEFSLRMDGGDDKTRTYPNARCILRVSGERVQDGWVRLSFQPELHHGQAGIKRTAGDGDWKLQEGQAIDRLLEAWFDVELHVGELVVIGGTGAGEDSVAARFFRSGDLPEATERILVLRVDEVSEIQPVRSE